MKALAALALAVCATGAVSQPLRGDAARGERAYLKCYSCHSIEAGEHGLDGPSLHAIIGRRVAAVPGFRYSPELRRFARRQPRWTVALLDRFIADPETLVPGTDMTFVGIRRARERADLIAYLRQSAR